MNLNSEKYGKDPYTYTEVALDRLINEYRKYGKIIIAYDFDGTVYDFHNEGHKYPRVMKLLKELKPYAHFVVYSASKEQRYPMMKEYLEENELPFDSINENIPGLNIPNGKKLYYNIFLDDRAGLGESVYILEEFLNEVK